MAVNMVLETFYVRLTLDAFASTAQPPWYMIWFRDPQAVALDALLHEWDPVTYLFPPVPLRFYTKFDHSGSELCWFVLTGRQLCGGPCWWKCWWSLLFLYLTIRRHPKCGIWKVPYLEPLVAAHISSLHLE